MGLISYGWWSYNCSTERYRQILKYRITKICEPWYGTYVLCTICTIIYLGCIPGHTCKNFHHSILILKFYIQLGNRIRILCAGRGTNALMKLKCHPYARSWLILEGPDNSSWWRHQMKTFSALLALYAGNSSVTGEIPSHRPVTRSFYGFFICALNKPWCKQSWGWWFEAPSRSLWRHFNVNCVCIR